jgi:predicted RNA binding protein YcfA (HicA-like mRNA interferase family)
VPHLPVVSGHEVARAFSKIGFAYDHQTGSHLIYHHSDGRHLSIPNHREVSRGVLRTLIRVAGLSVEEFIRLLQDA